jgi:hypothetical protein
VPGEAFGIPSIGRSDASQKLPRKLGVVGVLPDGEARVESSLRGAGPQT